MTQSLPNSYRWALTLAIVLGFQVALAAMFDVQTALHHDEPPTMDGAESLFPQSDLSPQAQRAIWLASVSGYQSALAAMRMWRIAASLLLALCSGLVFFQGLRLRMAPEHHSTLAFHLGSAALVAAVFRSIDGGLNLVLAEATARAVGQAVIHEGMPDADSIGPLLQAAFSAASGGWTLVMVALFVALGKYFRSPAFQQS